MSAGFDGRIRSWNQAAVAVLGWNESDVVGRPMRDILGRDFLVASPSTTAQRHRARVAHGRGGFIDADVVLDSSGDWSNGTGRTVVAVLPDASETAVFGAATTMRVHSWTEAADLIRAIGGSALCVIVKVLGLAAVNLGYSRSVGDSVLRVIGDRLQPLVTPDGSCVRVDGNRFVLVVPEIHWRADHENRLLAAVRDPIDTSQGGVRVAGCAGLATGFAESALVLLDRADVSLRAAIRQGAGALVRLESQPEGHELHAARIGSSLLAAMSSGAIEPHFQPVVDMDTGDIVMVEALARWRSVELGQVDPAKLITIAEEAGLIHELGRYILSRALDFIAVACHESTVLRAVAVNVSPRQLEHPSFVQHVISELDARDLDGAMLVLEMTDSHVVDDPSLSKNCLARLRDRGVRVAIDDFGAGRASFAYLTEVPVDIMKIDRRFVSHLQSHTMVESFVKSLIVLASDLDFMVIAEGVETTQQQAILRRLGCRYGQGFLYSPARPAAQAIQPIPAREESLLEDVVVPDDEHERITALWETGILDSPREPFYDDIVHRASTVCRTPAALITLVDERRVWAKAAIGLDIVDSARSTSFCAHTIRGDGVMEVSDARRDGRFETNPYVVGEPGIRFYAGVPVSTWDGHKLGTLSVIDFVPRALTTQQRQCLVELADSAARALDARRTESEMRNLRIQSKRLAGQLEDARERATLLFDSVADRAATVDTVDVAGTIESIRGIIRTLAVRA